MKFGKNLIQVVDLSNPEWGLYWINYKYLKRKINEIIEHRPADQPLVHSSDPKEIAKDAAEVEFFILIRKELKKASEFFTRCQEEFTIRWERIWESYLMLQEKGVVHDKNTWTRLLMACVRFYKDVLLLENFAIMNYCGFSKILKKHDKVTGFITRDAFMRNVMNHQNITHYPIVLDLIEKSEQLFQDIQNLDNVIPLQDDERLFIDAIRDMNYQASRMQAEESQETNPVHRSESVSQNSKYPVETSQSLNSAFPAETTMIAISVPQSTAESSSVSVVVTLPSSLIENESVASFPNSSSRLDPKREETTTTADTASNMPLSDRLDKATMLAVEAAKRLNCHNAPLDVPLALSWIHRVASHKEQKGCVTHSLAEDSGQSSLLLSNDSSYNHAINPVLSLRRSHDDASATAPDSKRSRSS